MEASQKWDILLLRFAFLWCRVGNMHTGDEGCQSLIGSNLLTFLVEAARLWGIQVPSQY